MISVESIYLEKLMTSIISNKYRDQDSIVKSYENEQQLLSIISNQKVNGYIENIDSSYKSIHHFCYHAQGLYHTTCAALGLTIDPEKLEQTEQDLLTNYYDTVVKSFDTDIEVIKECEHDIQVLRVLLPKLIVKLEMILKQPKLYNFPRHYKQIEEWNWVANFEYKKIFISLLETIKSSVINKTPNEACLLSVAEVCYFNSITSQLTQEQVDEYNKYCLLHTSIVSLIKDPFKNLEEVYKKLSNFKNLLHTHALAVEEVLVDKQLINTINRLSLGVD